MIIVCFGCVGWVLLSVIFGVDWVLADWAVSLIQYYYYYSLIKYYY